MAYPIIGPISTALDLVMNATARSGVARTTFRPATGNLVAVRKAAAEAPVPTVDRETPATAVPALDLASR